MSDDLWNEQPQEFWENLEEHVAYWRENPHRFATEYLGVKLYDFQKIALYQMSHGSVFYFWASRGLGKTWLCSLLVICLGVLFPGIKIRVAAPSIRQSNLFIKKIEGFANQYENIAAEISDINVNKETGVVRFHNGSECSTVVANDNARGERCQVLILDEGRLMNKSVVSSVLEPFLTEKRMPPYALNPKYKESVQSESNKEIFLSSIGTPSEWSYRDFVNACNFIAAGDKSYNVMSLPYQFGLESGIIDRAFIERQIREEKADPQSFQMEMEVIPYGESEHSLFTFDELNSSRKLRVPLVPITNDEFIEFGGHIEKSAFYRKKVPGELRVAVMDVAVSSAKNSDNSVIIIYSLFEKNISKDEPYYDKELSYIETMNGVELDKQVLRFKQVFYDLQCDYAVIDGNAALGINTFDICAQVTNDYFRNVRYPAWREHKLSPSFERPVSQEAEPVLYGIKTAGGNSGEIHYSMLIKSKLNLERGRLKLLANEEDVEEDLNRRYGFAALKSSNDAYKTNRARAMIMPFINTTSLIDEAIKTQVVRSQTGRVTFKEDKTTSRKDRVITMMYGIYFISLLEDMLKTAKPKGDYSKVYQGTQQRNATRELFGRKETFGGRRGVSPFGKR